MELLDDDVRFISEDPEAARFLGVPSGSLKGVLAGEIGIPLEVRREWIARFLESESTGHRVRFTSELPLQTGPLWVSAIVFPLSNQGTARRRFCIVLEDVTERMPLAQTARRLSVERDLRREAVQAERRLTSILESISDAFFTLDREWRFTYVNASAQRSFGMDREDPTGRVIWEAAPHAKDTRFHDECQRAMIWQRHSVFEVNGTPLNMLAEVHVYPTEDGLSVYFHDISERKRVEEALRESEERFRVALQNSPVAVSNQDRSLAYTWIHHPALRIAEEDMLGRRDRDIFESPADAEATEAIKTRVLSTGVGERHEVCIHVNGAPFYYDLTVEPLRDAQGEVAGITCAAVDITERRQHEAALRHSTERFRRLAETSAFGLLIGDAKGAITFANRTILRLLGYTHNDVESGRLWWEGITPPEFRARDLRALDELRETDRCAPYEKAFVTRDHRLLPVMVGASVLERLEDGGAVVAVFVTDLSALKSAEAAVREQEERLRLAVDAADLGVWEWDLSTDRLEWDTRCRSIFGLMPNAPMSYETFLGLLHPDDRERTVEAIRQSLHGHGDLAIEYRCIWPDGSVRWVMARGRRFTGSGAAPQRFIGTVQDIDEQKRSEAAMAAADRAKDEFLAVLGHELRNPLGAISNALQVTQLHQDDAAATARARQILSRQVDNMSRMVNDLLDVSRISRGKMELRQQRLDLCKVVEEAVAAVRPIMEEHRQQFELSLPSNPVWADVDSTRIDQVLTNLLYNAAKYSNAAGKVSVTLREEAGTAVMRVKDMGIGIAAEDLAPIFEPFVQVRRHTGSARGGLGIGLTLVRQIVEMHGGSVAAFSDGPGMGSEFVVTLPLAGPPEQTMASADLEGAATRGPCRVLVVDDNIDAAGALVDILSEWGHAADACYTGSDALNASARTAYDLILLDIGLPDIDGHEVARRLRDRPGGIKARLAALTGFGQEDDRRRSSEAGCDFHLVKPVDFAVLRELLNDVCTTGGD
ncbi:MAG TPA: PAS domain S-box protein [Armatimonadota bacterium]